VCFSSSSFVLFFIFILFHGKGGINPHYWMYAIPVRFCTPGHIPRMLNMFCLPLPLAGAPSAFFFGFFCFFSLSLSSLSPFVMFVSFT